jgi:hypothetical protein
VEQDETVAGLGGEHTQSAVLVQLREKRERGVARQWMQYRPAVAPRVEAALRRREEEIWRQACLLLVGLLVVEVDEGGRRKRGRPRARQAAEAADSLCW